MRQSQISAKAFIDTHTNRGGIAHQPRSQDVALLRQIVFNHVTRYRLGITLATLHAHVIDDYGACIRRRLERAIAWLLSAGRIERIGFGVYRLTKTRAK